MPSSRSLAAACVASVVVVTVALARHHDTDRTPATGPTPPAPRPASPPPGPPEPATDDLASWASTGFAHDAEGATGAALAYLAAGPSLAAMDEHEAVATQRAMAAASAADELAAGLRDQRTALVEGFGPGPLRWWVAPLATSVTTSGPDAAEVSIWYVSVVAPAGRPTYEDWRLARTRLVWEGGTWRVASEHDGPGPRPGVLARPEPSSPAELAGALAGFEAIGAPS
ncbi:MAG: hypothetical protein ACRD03_03535 [Acidimicrobiales bacterium]